jgi:hypothetical protein
MALKARLIGKTTLKFDCPDLLLLDIRKDRKGNLVATFAIGHETLEMGVGDTLSLNLNGYIQAVPS